LRHIADLPEEKLAEALARQEESGARLGEILVGMKAVTEEQVLRALALQLDLPFVGRIDDAKIEPDLVQKLPINFSKQFKLVPLWRVDGEVEVAVADPLDTAALDQARL